MSPLERAVEDVNARYTAEVNRIRGIYDAPSVKERIVSIAGPGSGVACGKVWYGHTAYVTNSSIGGWAAGSNEHEAMSLLLKSVANRAIQIANERRLAELDRINQQAAEDPRDARIRELERQLADEQAKTRAAAAALGAT